MCMCVRARVWIRTCPTSWAWLRACFVRCQPHSLKAKHSSDRNHTLFDLALPSKRAICLRSASVGTSTTVFPSLSLCSYVCACLRVSLHFCLQYGAYVDVTYACLFVCVRLKIHTARRGGSFNYITYWDMPVTGLWSALPGFCIHSRAFS